ncbi:MAG TPA: ATP-binding protein [Kofleriaceae bacterium]|nr:ATP-binding protein [Kofleriaceae bacterium]
MTWWIAGAAAAAAALLTAVVAALRGGRRAAEFTEVGQRATTAEQTVVTLTSERARLAAILEGLADGVIAVDARADVSLMNHAALEILGLSEAPVARPIYTLLRSPELQDLIASPGGRTSELDLPERNRRVLVRATPMTGGGYILVMSDVTEVRRLETVRRDFVANVSHELRTPVSIISANTETLLDGALDDPAHARPLLEAAHRNAERLSRIITDLLDLSRLEAGRYQIRREAVPAAVVASRAIDAVERTARERGTAITVEVPPALTVEADDKALEQVLVNYLENAVKDTPPGGKVHVLARPLGARVRIEVRDDGPGIEAGYRQRVFERFYRIDPGRSREMGGTGLGLSIVKHMAEAMGGSVGVEPVDPHGSTFWIELPAAAV